jgi:hypothetical protein
VGYVYQKHAKRHWKSFGGVFVYISLSLKQTGIFTCLCAVVKVCALEGKE